MAFEQMGVGEVAKVRPGRREREEKKAQTEKEKAAERAEKSEKVFLKDVAKLPQGKRETAIRARAEDQVFERGKAARREEDIELYAGSREKLLKKAGDFGSGSDRKDVTGGTETVVMEEASRGGLQEGQDEEEIELELDDEAIEREFTPAEAKKEIAKIKKDLKDGKISSPYADDLIQDIRAHIVEPTVKLRGGSEETVKVDEADIVEEMSSEEREEVTRTLKRVAAGEIDPGDGAETLVRQAKKGSDLDTMSQDELFKLYDLIKEREREVTQVRPASFEQAGAVEIGQAETSLYLEEEAKALVEVLEDVKRDTFKQYMAEREITEQMRDEYDALFTDLDRQIQEVQDRTMTEGEKTVVAEVVPITIAHDLADDLTKVTGPPEMKSAAEKIGEVFPIADHPDFARTLGTLDDVTRVQAVGIIDGVSEKYDPHLSGEGITAEILDLNDRFRQGGLSREENRQAKEKLYHAIQAATGVDLSGTKSEKMLVGLTKRGKYEPLYYIAERVKGQLAADVSEIKLKKQVEIEQERAAQKIQPRFMTEAMRDVVRRDMLRRAAPDAEAADIERNIDLRIQTVEAAEVGDYVLSGKISSEAAEKMLAMEEGEAELGLDKARRRIEVSKYREYEQAKESAYTVMAEEQIDKNEWDRLDRDIEETLARIESLQSTKGEKTGVSKILPFLEIGKDRAARKKSSEMQAYDSHLSKLLLEKAQLESDFWVAEGSRLDPVEAKRLIAFGFFRSIAGAGREGVILHSELETIARGLNDDIEKADADLATDNPMERIQQAERKLREYSLRVEAKRREIQRVQNVARVIDFMQESKSRRYRGVDFSGRDFLQAYREAQLGGSVGEYYKMQGAVMQAADKMQERTLSRLLSEEATPEAGKAAIAA